SVEFDGLSDRNLAPSAKLTSCLGMRPGKMAKVFHRTGERHPMTRDLNGRRILITGASSGIGKALAQQLAPHGAKLILTARSEDKLRAVADTLPTAKDNVLVVPTDITKEDDRQQVLRRAVEQFGGLDVLI